MRARYGRYRAAAETKVQFLPRRSETQEWTTVSAAKMGELAPRITVVNFKLLKAVELDDRRKVEFRVAVQGVDRVAARVDEATGEALPAAQRLWQWVSSVGYTKLSAVHKHVKKYPLRYQIDARATPIPAPPPQVRVSPLRSLRPCLAVSFSLICDLPPSLTFLPPFLPSFRPSPPPPLHRTCLSPPSRSASSPSRIHQKRHVSASVSSDEC
jgi:hypothetical protein